MIKAIIIGHHTLPLALKETLESIVGELAGVTIISNQGLSGEKLCAEINNALQSSAGDEPIVLVDIPGGSCAISCLSILKEKKGIPIICGVNLPVLLEFFVNRDRYPRERLVEILIEKGRNSIGRLGG